MPLSPLVLVSTLVVGLYATVQGLRDRAPDHGLLRALLVLQALLLVQAAVLVMRLLGESGVRPPSVVTYVGYLLLSVLLLLGAFALAVEERTRYGTLLLAGGCLVVAVVQLRLQATA